MRKQKKYILEKRATTDVENPILYMDIINQRLKILENTLKEIKGITERNQYGNSEISFRLIQEKINEVL